MERLLIMSCHGYSEAISFQISSSLDVTGDNDRSGQAGEYENTDIVNINVSLFLHCPLHLLRSSSSQTMYLIGRVSRQQIIIFPFPSQCFGLIQPNMKRKILVVIFSFLLGKLGENVRYSNVDIIR